MTRNTTTPPTTLRLADIPDVARPVALHGALWRGEVGGSYCFGIIVSSSLAMAR